MHVMPGIYLSSICTNASFTRGHLISALFVITDKCLEGLLDSNIFSEMILSALITCPAQLTVVALISFMHNLVPTLTQVLELIVLIHR